MVVVVLVVVVVAVVVAVIDSTLPKRSMRFGSL